MAHFPQNKGIFALFSNISKSIHMSFKILVHAIECTRKGGFPMKETTLPERIIRQANKVGLYNALSFGDIMLQGALQKK